MLAALAMLALAFAATAHAASSRVRVPGTAPAGQAGTTRTGNASAGQKLPFAVTLPLRNQADLRALIAKVSDPASPEYGHYLTPAQFAARFAPSDAQVQAVASFLRAQGIDVGHVSANNTVVDATATVAQAEKAFGVTIGRYHDPRLGRDYVANDAAVTVPSTVASDVVGVIGLDTHFRRQHPPLPKANPLTGAGPAGGYTPAQLKAAYDVNALSSAGYDGTGQKVGLFELAGFKQPNVTTFDNQYGLGSGAPTVANVDGGNATLGNAEVEVELDIELIQAIAPKASITVWEAPNTDQGVIDAYNAMATSDTTPANSTSWGECEAVSSAATINSEDQIYQQMAAQGQSLYAASGDSAAYDCGTSGSLGVDNPADDPYVTGAGGTRLTMSSSNAYSSETTWDTNATEGGGGGVSTKFARPSWQSGDGVPATCNMRCVPDISSNADPATGYSIYSQGSWTVVGGTSGAAPMWAGFTALYNQDATAAGKARLGYANPTLYSLAASSQTAAPFHDITTGHTSTTTYWPATTGYDLATGIGTYDASNLAGDLLGGSTNTGNDFSISVSPGSVTAASGASATATVSTAVTSGSAQTVALSASGLPSGATATFTPASVTAGSSSSLKLTAGTSTPAGSYPVTITGTGSSKTKTTTLTLVVTASGSSKQVVVNGGFEKGSSPWTLSAGVLNNSTSEPPHLGAWDAWFDGYGATHTDTATQSVTIPAGTTSAALTFWLHIDTAERTTTTAYDKFTVKVGGTTVATFSNLNKNSGYAIHTYSLGNLSGQTVTLSFSGTEDSSLQTSFVLDDVSLSAS